MQTLPDKDHRYPAGWLLKQEHSNNGRHTRSSARTAYFTVLVEQPDGLTFFSSSAACMNLRVMVSEPASSTRNCPSSFHKQPRLSSAGEMCLVQNSLCNFRTCMRDTLRSSLPCLKLKQPGLSSLTSLSRSSGKWVLARCRNTDSNIVTVMSRCCPFNTAQLVLSVGSL